MSTRLASGLFSLSQNCALIIPRDGNTSSAYFELALQPLFDYEKASISLIMQPSLRFSDLNRFSVPCPPLSEQLAIAGYVKAKVEQLTSLRERARREITLLLEYRTRLIADVVTGKFDVRQVAVSLSDRTTKEATVLEGIELLSDEELDGEDFGLDASLEEVEA